MKTQLTKKMEHALVADALKKGKHPALEVQYWHSESIGASTYRPVGQVEYIDAVVEEDGMFSCMEIKVSMQDLHSKAAQTFVGNKNYLVCPMEMAKKIKNSNDPWLKKYPKVGIIGWDGKESFRAIKMCKINYQIPINDWMTLAKGMISSMSKEIKKDYENDN
jgi:hypothetical protein